MEAYKFDIINRINNNHNLSFSFVETIQSTRGTEVLKVNLNGINYALKYIDKKAILEDLTSDPEYRKLSLLREAKILADIKDNFNYYFLSDEDSDFIWLVTHWIEGIPASLYFKQIRNEPSSREKKKKFITGFIKIVNGFSKLHTKGILHGDVQPVHIIFTDKNDVDFVDFGLSKYVTDRGFKYKGGLVHFNSPEVAEEMLKKADNIATDILTEIYSIGSVLFFLYTDKTSTYYNTYDYKSVPFEEKLKFIVNGNRNSFEFSGSESFPELEEVVNLMLEKDRDKRCNNLEIVITRLKEIEP